MTKEEEIFIIGKVNLNPVGSNKTPFIEARNEGSGGKCSKCGEELR